MRRIAVLGVESEIASPEALATALQLGQTLAEHGITAVTTGHALGTLGTMVDAVVRAGGRAIGVPLEATPPELVHAELTECHWAANGVHQRSELSRLADGFVVLPEAEASIADVLERLRADLDADHPAGLLDEAGCYSALLGTADDSTLDAFVGYSQRGVLTMSRSLGDLVGRLLDYRASDDRDDP